MPILAWITRRGVQNLAHGGKKGNTILTWLIPIQYKTKEKNQNHDKKTAHGRTAACFFFAKVENSPFVHLFFTTQILLHKGRPYKGSSSYSCWTRADGITTYLRFHHDGERANRIREGAPLPPASRAADKNVVFTTTRYILFAQAVRCCILGFRSGATPLRTSPPLRGTLYIHARAPLRGRLTPPATLAQERMQLTETCK